MINLVLDTNILHEEGFHSANMKRLSRLVSTGAITLHVPELVKREYLSKRIGEVLEKSTSYKSSITEFSKKFFSDEAMFDEMTRVSNSIAKLMEDLPSSVEASFEAWRVTVNANVIRLDMNSTATVFEEYFQGKGAFRKLKHREDIPDAFIANSILELSKDHQNIHVAVKDGALGKYLGTIKNLTISEDVKAFFALPAVKNLIDQMEQGDKQIFALKAFFSSEIFRQHLESVLREDSDLVQSIYVEEETITGTDHLTVYEFGAAINFPSPDDVDLVSFGDVQYVEDGYFIMPIDFSTTASVSYCTDYSTYINLPTEKLKLVEEVGMNGEGISEIIEKRDVHFFGNISLQFDSALTLAEIKSASEKMGSTNSQIVLNMIFDNAAILM